MMNYCRRMLGTILGFSLFGLGGILLCFTFFHVIILCTRNQQLRRQRIRSVIQHTFKIFLRLIEFLGVLKLNVHEMDSLSARKGCLIICNHPCLLDVVIIMSQLKNVQCVVKNQLWKNPFIGGVVRAAGYIRNDLPPEEFLKICQTQLKEGQNIIIFPEGTRTTPGQPIEMRRGLGNLALAAEADIQALMMTCYPTFLTKGQKWYNIPSQRAMIDLKVGSYFPIKSYQTEAPRSLRVRALMRDIQQYYNRNLGYE